VREARDAAGWPGWIEELFNDPVARRPYLPGCESRKRARQPLASHRVDEWNDGAVFDRSKGRRMSGTAEGWESLSRS
jgi:hypothetical protein